MCLSMGAIAGYGGMWDLSQFIHLALADWKDDLVPGSYYVFRGDACEMVTVRRLLERNAPLGATILIVPSSTSCIICPHTSAVLGPITSDY
jgi:hypothetical protein